jgi:glyoxylase-like metal-dependent hydrolase (beta-lactamase superfamily II)
VSTPDALPALTPISVIDRLERRDCEIMLEGEMTERQDWFEVVRFPAGVTMIAEPGHEEDVKSYLVEGEQFVAVLDTGMGVGDFAGLVGSLSDRQPIVLHSHAHFDHIGASARFERVNVHASEADDLREGYSNANFRRWFEPHHLVGDRLPEDFDPNSAEIERCEPTGTIEHGQLFDLGGRVLEAFHTPGHSPGGITLLDRENRLLFPGDAVYAGPMFAYRPYSDPVTYRDSLRLLAELADAVDVVYPSHNRVPLVPDEVRAMHAAYEEIWAGRTPDKRERETDIFEFEDFSFWLRRGAYGDSTTT